jgi:ankyrin repeat protein
MKSKLTRTIVAVGLFITGITAAHARGGTDVGGGGDPLALEFKATASVALKNLQALKGQPFTAVNFAELENKIDNAQVIVTDQALDVVKDGFVQDSAAENQPKQNLIIINRSSYQKTGSAIVQQSLALHEFLSLMQVESTANYPVSSAFLIANTGGTQANAAQKISAAASSLTAKPPCPEPNPDAGTLFAMIADPKTPVEAVASFVSSHLVAWDAINDQCETSFSAAIEQTRDDIFQTLYEHYTPDPNALQPGTHISIYSSVLRMGDLQALELLQKEALDHGQELKLDGDESPLDVAAEVNPSMAVIQYLLQTDSGASASSALVVAVCGGNTSDIANLLLQLSISQKDTNYTYAALPYAVSRENLDMVRALLKAGIDIDETGLSEETPLLHASGHGSIDMIRLLIQSGAKVNARAPSDLYSGGDTPLIRAAASNSVDVVTLLIQSGASVNDRDASGATPLFAAAESNTADVVQLLIQVGAQVNDSGHMGGTTPLMAAADWRMDKDGVDRYAQAAAQEDIIRALLAAGADRKATRSNGDSAWVIAWGNGAPQALLDLLK